VLNYGLDERPPIDKTIIYSIQWLTFTLANSAVVPLVVGSALGLDQPGIAALAQRILFFSALATLLQVLWGHRLPIMEGPSGMWWGIFITLAAMAPGLGKPLPLLRTDLELGMMVAGVILVVLGRLRLIGKLLRFFTPAVTGSVLVLLGLQLSGSFVRGMLGMGAAGQINPRAALVSLIVVALVFYITLRGKGFLKSVAVLAGITVGWVVSLALGVPGASGWGGVAFMQIPALFAWGRPTFDPGIVFTSVMTGVLVLSNLVASILAMEKAVGKEFTPAVYDRGVMFTGVADIMAGAGSTVGFVPYSAGAGLVTLTGVASRLPFILFAVIMLVLGLFPPVGALLSAIPEPVGYSVLMASFAQMLGFGLKDYLQLKLDTRGSFVIGLPLLFGTGVMFLSPGSLTGIPALLRYILGNGFITGMILVILLEHVILPDKNRGQDQNYN
jgi:xanthine/uracil permease